MPRKNYVLLLFSCFLGITIFLYFFSLKSSRDFAPEINVATPSGDVKLDFSISEADKKIVINTSRDYKVVISQTPANLDISALSFIINIPAGKVDSVAFAPLVESSDIKYSNFESSKLQILIASKIPFRVNSGTEILSFKYTAPATAQAVTLSNFTNNSVPSIIDVSGVERLNSASLNSISLNVVLPNQAPAKPVVSLSPSSINVGGSVTISATATDSDGSISKVEFFSNNSLISSATSPFSITYKPASAATYSITAKSTDNAGAVSAVSDSVSLVVAPAPVPLGNVTISPNAGFYIKGKNTITFSNAVSGVTYKYCIEAYNGANNCTPNLTYSTGIAINENIRIRVIAQKSGYLDSSVSTQVYRLIGDMPPVDNKVLIEDLIPMIKKLLSGSTLTGDDLLQVDTDKNDKFELKDIIDLVKLII
ncbi:hypothetical protein KA001_02760 [Patescibacteria group bacterium]|nr:hypothetical protein [Patescibacteria group bacterium]